MKPSRRPLSEEEMCDTIRLRSAWDEASKTRYFTQKEASEEFGFKNQSAISQYLNGRIPLNLKVAAKFAKYLQVPLGKISPRYSAVTRDVSEEVTLLKRMQNELLLQGHCSLVELDDQGVEVIGEGAWYVLDTKNKRVSDGVFAVKTEHGAKLVRMEAQRGSFRVSGIGDDDDSIVMPISAAALIAVEGKVIYKISKV